MVFATSTGYEISNQVACELKNLYLQSRGEHIAGRLWRQILSEEDRAYLGGDFRQAFLAEEHRMVGIYNRLYSQLSVERSMLEALRQLGWIPEARYERLVEAIGEGSDLLPRRGGRPEWRKPALYLRGQLIRQIRQTDKAFRIVSILDAFELRGWPPHLTYGQLKLEPGRELREAVATLNRGLEAIVFKPDGTGKGVLWSRR
jgi:hypothetical protein